MSQDEKPKTLTDLISDPEMAETLETLRRMAVRRGGDVGPLVDLIAGSFAMIGDASMRAQYDEIRRGLVAYLKTLDLSGTPALASAPFERSPEVSEANVEAAARVLVETAASNRSRR